MKKSKNITIKTNKPKQNIDFDSLPMPLVDGVLDETKTFILRRKKSGVDVLSYAQILKIDANGTLTLWDETFEQKFLLSKQEIDVSLRAMSS